MKMEGLSLLKSGDLHDEIDRTLYQNYTVINGNNDIVLQTKQLLQLSQPGNPKKHNIIWVFSTTKKGMLSIYQFPP